MGLIHYIACVEKKNDHDPFIQKYVLPDSSQPKLSEVVAKLENHDMAVLDVDNLVTHYGYTLRAWTNDFSTITIDSTAAATTIGSSGCGNTIWSVPPRRRSHRPVALSSPVRAQLRAAAPASGLTPERHGGAMTTGTPASPFSTFQRRIAVERVVLLADDLATVRSDSLADPRVQYVRPDVVGRRKVELPRAGLRISHGMSGSICCAGTGPVQKMSGSALLALVLLRIDVERLALDDRRAFDGLAHRAVDAAEDDIDPILLDELAGFCFRRRCRLFRCPRGATRAVVPTDHPQR